MRIRSSFFLVSCVIVSSAAAFAIGACVGDAPAASEGNDASAGDAANGADGSASGDGSTQGDSGPTGPCNLAADFSTPVPVPGLETVASAARFSDDELVAYYAILSTDGGPQYIGQATRGAIGDTFGEPVFLPTVGPSLVGFQPSVTSDRRTIYFAANVFDGGGPDIFVAQRLDADASFGAASGMAAIESSDKDEEPFIAFSGDLWFASERADPANFHIYRSQKSGAGLGAPAQPNNVNSTTGEEEYPLPSRDGLTLYLSHSGPDTQQGSKDVYFTQRSSLSADFPPPAPLPNVNTTDGERAAWLSPDGCRLYIARGTGALTMFVASKPPN